jgi:hypothetical protein
MGRMTCSSILLNPHPEVCKAPGSIIGALSAVSHASWHTGTQDFMLLLLHDLHPEMAGKLVPLYKQDPGLLLLHR